MPTTPVDQASELRRLMASRSLSPTEALVGKRLSQRPRNTAEGGRATSRRQGACVVAIASGKGGVGKTNLAVNLAICLARRGRRVVLVDADLGTANIDVVMNIRSRFDLSDVISGRRRIDEVAVPIDHGLRLVAGASGLASVADLSPIQRQTLIEELGRLEADADIMLLDCGAGISQNVLVFAQACDELLVVTTPEPTALTDAYALIKVLSRAPRTPHMSLVVSMANTTREGAAVAQRIASVAARYLGVSVGCSGQIVRDPHVALAVRQRVPFVIKYPQCPASSCVSALAARVDQASSEAPARSGFFRRVFNFFC